MDFDQVPGLTIGFIKDDFTWVKGFGWADLENKTPAKPESSYRLASITKTFTAVAVLQLAEEGKIDLDSEIQEYVPYFPRKKWPVTVRQLLGHLGGISHYRDYSVEGRIKEPKTTRQSLAIFQDFDLVAEPGTRYNYSSYGYNLLGAAIEGASNLPYGEYVRSHIFEPLGMSDSRLDDSLAMIPNRVQGYQLIQGKLQRSEFVDISSRFASGGLRSTVVDLLKYARAVIEGRLLKETTWRKAFSPMAQRNGLLTWYGMGWQVHPWKGHFAAGHSGAQPETRTQLLVFPAEGFAAAAACNLEETNLVPYLMRLLDLILDEDIDCYGYATDRNGQAVYDAVFQVFNHGLSYYDWNKMPMSKSRNDLNEAFDYFQVCVGDRSLKENFIEAKKRILTGAHLVSNQAFTKVGSYMAQALSEAGGEDMPHRYHRLGPIAFFDDYIQLSTSPAAPKRHPRFKSDFAALIAGWRKDWDRTYTDRIKHLVITPDMEIDSLVEEWKESFAGASLYPDLTAGLARVADSFIRRNSPERAAELLASALAVYPKSAFLLASSGVAHLWKGDEGAGIDLIRRAQQTDPVHPAVSSEELLRSAGQLGRERRVEAAIVLAKLAAEFYPRETGPWLELSSLYLLKNQKDEAMASVREALKINPRLQEAKALLEKIEKKK